GRRPPGTRPGGPGDIVWLTPSAQEIAWHDPGSGAMAVFLNGAAVAHPRERGATVPSDSFLLLFNALSEPVTFSLPGPGFAGRWQVTLDTGASNTRAVQPADAGSRGELLASEKVGVA